MMEACLYGATHYWYINPFFTICARLSYNNLTVCNDYCDLRTGVLEELNMTIVISFGDVKLSLQRLWGDNSPSRWDKEQKSKLSLAKKLNYTILAWNTCRKRKLSIKGNRKLLQPYFKTPGKSTYVLLYSWYFRT